MAEFKVTIEVLSPIHLGSGQADVTVDSEIIHDALGFPYFPAKRFKGLLHESAVEIYEMFELAGMDTKKISKPEKIFHRESDEKGNVSKTQLIVPNFFIKPLEEYQKFCAEWQLLQSTYQKIFKPSDIRDAYTSLRYQTQLENGIAAKGSLRNLRVLNAGVKFFGAVTLIEGTNCDKNLLALAIRNLTSAGMKRNRGFGRIKCSAKFEDGLTDSDVIEKFFARGA